MIDEREWWDGLRGTDIVRNAWGWPPYDVDRVAQRIITALQPERGARILDLGCGPGRTAVRVAQRAEVSVVGVDIAQSMLDVAAHHPGVSYVLGNGRILPDAKFDHVYSVTMFEHIPHLATFGYLAQIYNRLPAGGRLIFSHTPGSDPQTFLHHQCRIEEVWAWLDYFGFTMMPVDPDPVLDEEVWAWFCAQK